MPAEPLASAFASGLRPRRFRFAAALLALLLSGSPLSAADSGRSIAPTQSELDHAVEELGSPDFHARERAQAWLAQRGFDAVDVLTQAQNHDDLEVAQRAQYLVRRLKVTVTDPGDSDAVRKELEGYLGANEAERRQKIEAISKLSGTQALVPLCRLVRFDPSLVLSKIAAAKALPLVTSAVLTETDGPKEKALATLGNSGRPGAQWLRWRFETADDEPARRLHLQRWETAADGELALLQTEPRRTRPEVAQQLLRLLAEAHRQAGDLAGAHAAMLRAVPIEPERSPTLILVAREYVAARNWEGLTKLAVEYGPRMERDAELCYLIAEGFRIQKRDPEALQWVHKAAAVDPTDRSGHFRRAVQLARRGQHDWSEAEAEVVRRLPDVECDLSLPEDSARVQEILSNFLQRPEEERASRIEKLAEMPPGEHLPALCRIVRFDPSDAVCREAAVAILAPPYVDDYSWKEFSRILRVEVGAGGRAPADWVLGYLEAREQPLVALGKFAQWAAAERAALQTAAPTAQSAHTMALFALERRRYLLLKEAGQGDEAERLLDQILAPGAPERLLVAQFDFLLEEQAWKRIDQLAEATLHTVQGKPVPMFIAARAQAELGKTADSERTAARAISYSPGAKAEHWKTSFELTQRGLIDAAKKEYRGLIDLGPPHDPYVLNAKIRLAEVLHDQNQNVEAAGLVSDVLAAIQEDASLKRWVGGDEENWLPVRRLFFLAQEHKAKGDRKKQLELLTQAAKLNPHDADVLITLHRFPDLSDDQKAEIAKQVEAAIVHFRKLAESEPANATNHNQSAWLIGNTQAVYEGVDDDAKKKLRDEAVQASEKSLELRPGTAGYLDTLARCRFARGEYEAAVQIQSAAVRMEPFSASLTRQLGWFKKVQAEVAAGRPVPTEE